MAYSTTNVIVGAAAVFLSAKDSDDPTFYESGTDVPAPKIPTSFQANVSAVNTIGEHSDWDHVGFTTEGVEFSYEPDFGEVQVDQLLDVAKMFKQGMRASVNTTFAEATLKNLMIAWGQKSSSLTADTSGTLTISAGELGDAPVERSLAFVGPAPRSSANIKQERIYWLRRALQVEASNHSLSRNDATVIPASFRLLPVAGASGADYGTIRDRLITSTS